MKYVNIAGIVLYALLGVAMSMAGVGVVSNPLGFFAIMLVVVLIDINSARLVMKAYYDNKS